MGFVPAMEMHQVRYFLAVARTLNFDGDIAAYESSHAARVDTSALPA